MTRLREAMAEAVKSPEVTKTFATAGSPVAYMDAPEFAQFVADNSARLIAAVKTIGKLELGVDFTFNCAAEPSFASFI